MELKARQQYHYIYDDDSETTPIITLRVLGNDSSADHCNQFEIKPEFIEHEQPPLEIPEINENYVENNKIEPDEPHEENRDSIKTKSINEYLLNDDGSVICKLCGEVLQSRTHWYRHKYKLHVVQSMTPAPIFQCEQCLVFFKSRKGYIGHIASRHSELLVDSNPVLTNEQAEGIQNESHIDTPPNPISKVREDSDLELEIPKSSVPNHLTMTIVRRPEPRKTVEEEKRKPYRRRHNCEQQTNDPDCEEKRVRDEKFITDIIDRVKKECEAKGVSGPARRCYSRRANVT